MAAHGSSAGNGLQACRAQQPRFLLRYALTAEMTAARGTPADRFPQLMVPAALMNEDARHSGLKDSMNLMIRSPPRSTQYMGSTIPERRSARTATRARLPASATSTGCP